MNVFFTDLDDTLFSSLGKHPPGAELQEEAVLRDGTPISYSNSQQRGLRTMMTGDAMIPVTARNIEAFRRARVKNFRYAVCSNGATILTQDHSLDRTWADQVKKVLRPQQPAMTAFAQTFQSWATKFDVRYWLVEDDHLGAIYFVAKSNRGDENLLAEKAGEVQADLPDWVGRVHCNGNNLALIPRGISKEQACVYLREKIEPSVPGGVFFGVGDSISDWEFMAACDFAIIPTGSQIAEWCGANSAPGPNGAAGRARRKP